MPRLYLYLQTFADPCKILMTLFQDMGTNSPQTIRTNKDHETTLVLFYSAL